MLAFCFLLFAWCLNAVGFAGLAQQADTAFTVDVKQYSELHSATTSAQGKIALLGRQAYTDGRLLGNLTVLDAQGRVDLAYQQQAGFIETDGGATATLPGLVRFYADGRLLLASNGNINCSRLPQARPHLLRLQPDGTPDFTFRLSPSVLLPNMRVVAIQPDGKVLWAGSNNPAIGVGCLIRLNADGTLDTGFSASIGGRANDYVAALAVQADGKILVGGFFVSPAPALVRLLPNGQRDLTFQTNVTSGGDVQEILLRPGGQILVASRPTLTLQGRAGGLQQLLPTGSLDPAFQAPAAYGFVKTGDGRRVHLLRGGTLLALPTTPAAATAMRLLPSGQPDPAFAAFPRWPVHLRIATPDTAGALLVGGVYRHLTPGLTGSVLRMRPTLQFDPGFGLGLYKPGEVLCLIEQPGLGVVLAGHFDLVNGCPSPNLARLRLRLAEVDTAFSNRVPRNNSLTRVVLLPPGNQLLITGFSSLNETTRGSVARLEATGQLDPQLRTYPAGYSVYGLAAQPDGRFVAAGPFAFLYAQLDAARFLANGDFDPSFTVAQSLRFGSTTQTLVQPDGRIVLLDGTVAVRVHPNGQFDPTFAPTALRTYANAFTEDAVLQPNGRITVCGQMPGASPGRPGSILRLLPNGRRDSTLTDPLDRTAFRSRSLSYYPDGRLLVGGNFFNNSSTAAPTIGLYQLLPTGAIDPGFAAAPGAGRVSTVLRTSYCQVLAGGSFYFLTNALYQQLSFAAFTAALLLAMPRAHPVAALVAYPNPAHGQLHLRLDTAAGPASVSLLDALGRPVLSQRAVQVEMSLPTATLPAGTYFLRVDYRAGPTSRRVVIE